MNESGERKLNKRQRLIVGAIVKFGGEATIQDIARETGLSANGISQTLGSKSIADFVYGRFERKKKGKVYGVLTAMGRVAYGLSPDEGTLDYGLSTEAEELPPPKRGPDVLF